MEMSSFHYQVSENIKQHMYDAIKNTVFPPNMAPLLIIAPPSFKRQNVSSQKSYVSSCYFLHLQQCQ